MEIAALALHSARAHLATARIAAVAPLSDGMWIAFSVGLRFVRILILLAIWRALIPSGAVVGGYALGTALTYSLVAELFAPQLHVRTPIAGSLWNGAIANRFTWPMPVVSQFAAEMIGDWLWPTLAVGVPLLLLAPLLGVSVLPASGQSLVLFVISLALAVSVGLAIDMAYTVVTIRLDLGTWLLDPVRTAVETICSGALIPLGLLPFHLGAVFQWLPFASAASAPLRIYTATGDPSLLLLIQVGWLVVLTAAVRAAWQANRERIALYGG